MCRIATVPITEDLDLYRIDVDHGNGYVLGTPFSPCEHESPQQRLSELMNDKRIVGAQLIGINTQFRGVMFRREVRDGVSIAEAA